MYMWDNVYLYDVEFRIHISQNPERHWSTILQQAWSMFLKDRVKYGKGSGDSKNRSRTREPCRRFNKGNCTYGINCKFDHRCSIPNCGKLGHGAHICRRRNDRRPREFNDRGHQNDNISVPTAESKPASN